MIVLKNLSKVFMAGGVKTQALDNITMQVPTGTIYGVIGTSGAGKSTLIRCVNLLERPSSGQVLVNGCDLTQLSATALRQTRRTMGMIFQHFNLLASRTVYQNIALPLQLAGANRQAIAAAVNPLLVLTGLQDKRDHYPGQLSGGQKQRVAIARALANQPTVLLCDEATSALDPQTTRAILALLQDINRQLQITVLLITHEMTVVKSICDRVALLSQGQLVEENNVTDFFLHPKTALAQQFVRHATHEKTAAAVVQGLQATLAKVPTPGARPVIRIVFVGHDVGQPLITQAARQFSIDFVILQADVETVGRKMMGFLMVEMAGADTNVNAALAFLKERVTVELLGYVT